MKNLFFLPAAFACLAFLTAGAQSTAPKANVSDTTVAKAAQKNEARKNLMAQARMDAWESLKNSGQLQRDSSLASARMEKPVTDLTVKPAAGDVSKNTSAVSKKAVLKKPVAKTSQVKKKPVKGKIVHSKKHPVDKASHVKNTPAKKSSSGKAQKTPGTKPVLQRKKQAPVTKKISGKTLKPSSKKAGTVKKYRKA